MTKEEFQKRLEGHDWYYDMSDDLSVWQHGRAARGELERLASATPEFARMFDDVWFLHFCPPTFRTTREDGPMLKKGLYSLDG